MHSAAILHSRRAAENEGHDRLLPPTSHGIKFIYYRVIGACPQPTGSVIQSSTTNLNLAHHPRRSSRLQSPKPPLLRTLIPDPADSFTQ